MVKEKQQNKSTITPSDESILMYIGPTISSPVLLNHRSVYKGELPAYLETELKDKYNDVVSCFIPVEDAAAALRELEGQTPAGEITEKYKRIQKIIGGRNGL